jgi:hypothetical protein
LRVFDNKVLRRISAPKRVKVVGRWSRVRNEELQNLYTSIRVI